MSRPLQEIRADLAEARAQLDAATYDTAEWLAATDRVSRLVGEQASARRDERVASTVKERTMRSTSSTIPSDYPVQPVKREDATDPATCGTCGLTWDDAIVTSMTPTPAARCPFEAFHADIVVADAEARGADDGRAAGSWVIDGNTSADTARAILQGIEDGDPEVLDQLPASPLSGEWADGLLPRDVLAWYDRDEDADDADEILTAYEDGYSAGVVEEVERSSRAIL